MSLGEVMEKLFSDALAESKGFSMSEIPVAKLFSKRCIDDSINTFMDICNIDASCIALVIPLKHKIDGSGYVFELSFLVSLISEESDLHVSIGKDAIGFTIKTPVLKRKYITIKGSFNGITFEFERTIDNEFYKPLSHKFVITSKDGERFKRTRGRRDYKSDSEYVESFNDDIKAAKEFIKGDAKKDSGAKSPKRKKGGVYNYC